MSALPFNNKTNKTKFEGTFILNFIEYKYTIYLVPITRELPIKEQNEIIRFFGNRKYKEKICLDVDEYEVRYYLFYNLISAFIIVQPVGTNNIVSGTLQIYNRCFTENQNENEIDLSDVWINDICKSTDTSAPLSSGNTAEPLKAFFFLIEQLVVQNLGKTNMKLYVERNAIGYTKLKPIYISHGFNNNIDDKPNICPSWKDDELVMEKSNLTPQTTIIDFSFLNISPYNLRPRKKVRSYGGRYKKHKNNKKTHKMHKRKYIHKFSKKKA